MDIGKLFNGIAVIVDNEIENKTSAIYKIKELIEAKTFQLRYIPKYRNWM